MLRSCAVALVLLFCWTAPSTADQLCAARDGLVKNALQSYQVKARISGDIIERISWYAPRVGRDQIDPRSIRFEDVQLWRAALEDMLRAGEYALMKIRDFQSAGCDVGPEGTVARAISTLEDGLRIANSQLEAITRTPTGSQFSYFREGADPISTGTLKECLALQRRNGGTGTCMNGR